MIAAIGSYCDARANNGAWHVRIDDIDAPRVTIGATDDILRTLAAFGLEWDSGIVFQSRNTHSHHAALHVLRNRASVFPCACSRKEISESGVPGIDGPIYTGACRNGLTARRRARSLRLRIDSHTQEVFTDLLQGPFTQKLDKEVGDFVVYRSDGVFSYHLACVVDDAQLGITHIVRGADLIHSTPRQIHLQRLLGLTTPVYLHLPVAINDAGDKLSKQRRAPKVNSERPGETIHDALNFLGQQPPAELKRMPARTAIEWAVQNWQRAKVPRSRAIAVPSAA